MVDILHLHVLKRTQPSKHHFISSGLMTSSHHITLTNNEPPLLLYSPRICSGATSLSGIAQKVGCMGNHLETSLSPVEIKHIGQVFISLNKPQINSDLYSSQSALWTSTRTEKLSSTSALAPHWTNHWMVNPQRPQCVKQGFYSQTHVSVRHIGFSQERVYWATHLYIYILFKYMWKVRMTWIFNMLLFIINNTHKNV